MEEIRRRIKNSEKEGETISKELVKATGMGIRSIEMKLCNTRESQERICFSYRRLIVSIASHYQGRGLSLQDLIQVLNNFNYYSLYLIFSTILTYSYHIYIYICIGIGIYITYIQIM